MSAFLFMRDIRGKSDDELKEILEKCFKDIAENPDDGSEYGYTKDLRVGNFMTIGDIYKKWFLESMEKNNPHYESLYKKQFSITLKTEKLLEKEKQKVAMLKEALERVACLSQEKADETYYWDRNDRTDLSEIICDDIVMARETLQKLKEME